MHTTYNNFHPTHHPCRDPSFGSGGKSQDHSYYYDTRQEGASAGDTVLCFCSGQDWNRVTLSGYNVNIIISIKWQWWIRNRKEKEVILVALLGVSIYVAIALVITQIHHVT